jgi:hypothetical protein
MADRIPRSPQSNAKSTRSDPSIDRFPTKAELLADLTTYGDKRSAPHESPTVSRRTRDYLLTAGVGSAAIVIALVKLMPDSSGLTVVRLAFTAVGLFCALLWYIFYGLMSRY